MRLSVVIPTLGRDRLARALDHLEAQTAAPDVFEVIVVEDPSGSGRVGELVRGREGVRVVSASRPGASAARNSGWREARAALVLFLGDDILAAPVLVERHLAMHARYPAPDIGVLGRVDWARELRLTPFMRWLDRGVQFDYDTIAEPAGGRPAEAGWWRLYTANCSLKRDAVAAVGGFDEEGLPFLYEDLDLGKRMSERGFRLLYEPRAHAEHLHPVSLEEWRGRVAAIAAAERAFVAKHPDFEPYFFEMFRSAADAPRGRDLLARLAPVVSPAVPGLGPRVWASVDRRFRRALAPAFLDAWGDAPAADARGTG